ncbi:MAG: hypothetical protein ACRC5Q_04425 [Culicoidibacterales bacterium]
MKKVIFTIIEQKIMAFYESEAVVRVEIENRELSIARHKLPKQPITKAILAEYILHEYIVFK